MRGSKGSERVVRGAREERGEQERSEGSKRGAGE